MILNSNKIKLIFDGSILKNYLYKNSSRSGILFVAVNILKELAQKDNLEITVSCNNCSTKELQQLNDLGIIPKNCKTINFLTNKLIDFLLNLKPKIQKNTNDSLSKKILRFCINRILFLYSVTLNCNKELKSVVSNNDIYLSVCDPIPNYIRQNKKILHYLLVHDVIPLALKTFYGEKYKRRICGMEKVLHSIKKTDRLFAVSEHTKKDLKKYLNINEKNISVTQIAAHKICQNISEEKTNFIKNKYGIEDKYFLSISTIEPRKNLEFAINNFTEFIEKYEINDLSFIIAGAEWSEYTQVIDDVIKNNRQQNKIKKIGYIDDFDVPVLCSEALCFIYPSLYEGFGLPVLEAMQFKCPVITSNITSMPEVAGDSAILINPYNDKEMQDAYKKIYFNLENREMLINKGKKNSEKFSWDKCVNIMYNKFKEDLKNEAIV